MQLDLTGKIVKSQHYCLTKENSDLEGILHNENQVMRKENAWNERHREGEAEEEKMSMCFGIG